MKEIKHKLYALYFFIVAVFILFLYFLLSHVVEERLVEHQRTDLEQDMVVLAEYVEEHEAESQLNGEEIIQLLEDLAPVLQKRMTVIDLEGQPLYDSITSVDPTENIFDHPEIQQLLRGESMSVYQKDPDDEDHDQYAVSQVIFNQNEEPLVIVRLSHEITTLTSAIQLSLRIQLIGTIILAIVIIALATNWMNRITDALTEMGSVMTRLKNADYEARYRKQSYQEVDALGHSMNELAVNLKQQKQDLKASEERIYGLINHLVIGVILLDETRHIQMVNPIVNELLGTNLYGKITHLYTDYIRSAELIELIEEAYEKNETINAELKMYFPEEKTLDANVIPVPGKTAGTPNYIVLLYDITEIRRLENIRTDFATNVSHELRTPITALKGFSETLLDGAMYDQEVLTEFLEIMLKESTRLDHMVQDILQLSKLEQGRALASTEAIEVRYIVEEVFQILQQKIELKNMTCFIKENEPIKVRGNRDDLKQILMNLIANAITYTPENGEVFVQLERVGHEAKIQIIDNGIGIPEEDQVRIFERFYRVDKARSRNSGGTGLGLSIVKWAVDNMNGRIELTSKESIGTTFTIWLPLHTEKE
jgi:two-component system phosphate regulon sensor histidine kinase PhoR